MQTWRYLGWTLLIMQLFTAIGFAATQDFTLEVSYTDKLQQQWAVAEAYKQVLEKAAVLTATELSERDQACSDDEIKAVAAVSWRLETDVHMITDQDGKQAYQLQVKGQLPTDDLNGTLWRLRQTVGPEDYNAMAIEYGKAARQTEKIIAKLQEEDNAETRRVLEQQLQTGYVQLQAWQNSIDGYVKLINGQTDQAFKLVSDSMATGISHPSLWSLYGYLLKQRGETDLALQQQNQALRFNAKYAAALYNRAMLYMDQDHNDLALADLNAAIAQNAQLVRAYLGRARAYERKNDWDNAIKDYNDYLSVNQREFTLYYHTAELCEKAGHIAQAIDGYKTFLAFAPDSYGFLIESAHERLRELTAK